MFNLGSFNRQLFTGHVFTQNSIAGIRVGVFPIKGTSVSVFHNVFCQLQDQFKDLMVPSRNVRVNIEYFATTSQQLSEAVHVHQRTSGQQSQHIAAPIAQQVQHVPSLQLTPAQAWQLAADAGQHVVRSELLTNNQYSVYPTLQIIRFDQSQRKPGFVLQQAEFDQPVQTLSFEDLVAEPFLPSVLNCDLYIGVGELAETNLGREDADVAVLGCQKCFQQLSVEGRAQPIDILRLGAPAHLLIQNKEGRPYEATARQTQTFNQKGIFFDIQQIIYLAVDGVYQTILSQVTEIKARFYPKGSFTVAKQVLQEADHKPEFIDLVYPINRFERIESMMRPSYFGSVQLKQILNQYVTGPEPALKFYYQNDSKFLVAHAKTNKIVYPASKTIKPEFVQWRTLFKYAVMFMKMEMLREALDLLNFVEKDSERADRVLNTFCQFYRLLCLCQLKQHKDSQQKVANIMEVSRLAQVLMCAGMINSALILLLVVLQLLDQMQQEELFFKVMQVFIDICGYLSPNYLKSPYLVQFVVLFQKRLPKTFPVLMLQGLKIMFSQSVMNALPFSPHELQMTDIFSMTVYATGNSPYNFSQLLTRSFTGLQYMQIQATKIMNSFDNEQIARRGFFIQQLRDMTQQQPDMGDHEPLASGHDSHLDYYIPITVNTSRINYFADFQLTVDIEQMIKNESQSVQAVQQVFQCYLQRQISSKQSIKPFEYQMLHTKNTFKRVFGSHPVQLKLSLPPLHVMSKFYVQFQLKQITVELVTDQWREQPLTITAQVLAQYFDKKSNSIVAELKFLAPDEDFVCEKFQVSEAVLAVGQFVFRAKTKPFCFALYNKYSYLNLIGVQSLNSVQVEQQFGIRQDGQAYLAAEFRIDYVRLDSFGVNTEKNQWVFSAAPRTPLKYSDEIRTEKITIVVLTQKEIVAKFHFTEQVIQIQLKNFKRNKDQEVTEAVQLHGGSLLRCQQQMIGNENGQLVLKKLGYSLEHLVFRQNSEQLEFNFKDDFAVKSFFVDQLAAVGDLICVKTGTTAVVQLTEEQKQFFVQFGVKNIRVTAYNGWQVGKFDRRQLVEMRLEFEIMAGFFAEIEVELEGVGLKKVFRVA